MIRKRTLWMAIIVSLVIGGIAGFEINRFYSQHSESHFGKTRFLNFMTQELGLSDIQQRQLDSIITFVHPKFQAIRKGFRNSMQSQVDSTQSMIRMILSPQQRVRLDSLDKKMQSSTGNK